MAGDYKQSLILTTGTAGSGKSYCRGACFLADVFFKNYSGDHWSNFPLEVGQIGAYVEKEHGIKSEEVIGRIKLIPEEILQAWRFGKSGPWDFWGDIPKEEWDFDKGATREYWAGRWFPETVRVFKNKKGIMVAGIYMDGSHIAIDEAHNFIGAFTHSAGSAAKQEKAQKLQAWQEILGEIRHRGCKIEFLTQSPKKMHPTLMNEIQVKIYLTNMETERLPIINILYGDWLELKAKFFTGSYRSRVLEQEQKERLNKWVVSNQKVWRLEPRYFKLYNSYSAPESGGMAASKDSIKHEFQRRGRLSLLWWFLERNIEFLVKPMCVLALIVVMMLFGRPIMQYGLGSFMSIFTGKKAQAVESTPSKIKPSAPTLLKKSSVGSKPRKKEDRQLIKLREEIKRLQNALVQRDNEMQSLKREIGKLGAVKMLMPGVVILASGSEYKEGEVIDYGEWTGRKIERVEYSKRRVHLDDGTILRFGFAGVSVTQGIGGQIKSGMEKGIRSVAK